MSKWNPFRDEDLSKKQTILAVGLVFVVAGISGWVYEELFYRLNDGVFSWRGHGVGPWLPIYAFGTLILLFATAPVKDSKWKTVLLCALLSGGFEFLVGWALYHLYDGLRSGTTTRSAGTGGTSAAMCASARCWCSRLRRRC